ncbi:MAG: hypothetical protein RMJ35_12615 [Phycisphaerales bacterium]|nr:hypothetical protein [Phycisphaerales bacterium]
MPADRELNDWLIGHKFLAYQNFWRGWGSIRSKPAPQEPVGEL